MEILKNHLQNISLFKDESDRLKTLLMILGIEFSPIFTDFKDFLGQKL